MLVAIGCWALMQVSTAISQHADTAATGMLTIRSGDKVTRVPLVTTGSGEAVAADKLARALGGAVTPLDDGRYLVVLAGARLHMADGFPIANADTGEIPLPAAPYVAKDVLYLPLPIISDV